MITFDAINSIAEGMAWAADIRPSITDFHIDLTLPFPFYEALQKDLAERAMTLHGSMPDPATYPIELMRFIHITLPSGIQIHLKKGERSIIFERTPAKVIPITQKSPGGQLLFPFTGTLNNLDNSGPGNSDLA